MRSPVILIIDDNEPVIRGLGRVLRAAGYETLTANSPELPDGVYARCDLVVTDWDMPDGGGERVLRESTKPVIVRSGNFEVVDALRKAGRVALDKTGPMAELLAEIAKMLGAVAVLAVAS